MIWLIWLDCLKSQLFQRFFPITDIATYRLNQPRGKIIWNAKQGGKKEKGLPLQSFSSIHGWTRDLLSIGRHQHKDLKWTELCLGPIQTRLEAFLVFLVKTKIKAYTKLTVVMCCQIVARKSVAPSRGDFRRRPALSYACGQDQEFWRKKVLVK